MSSALAASPALAARPGLAAPHESVDEYRAFVYRTALRILRHREDAEDATQDVLVRVMRFLPAFGHRAAVTTWLYRVTFNVCMNQLRRRNLERACRQHLAQLRSAARSWDELHERLAVRQAVERLPAHYRRPLELFFFRELSYVQIALELGLPVNTVKIRIHRAKLRLRRTWS